MKVTQSKVDDLNAVLTVSVDKEDYAEKVNKALKNYKKNANVPGFRKGQVPMGLIKKQYEKPLIYDEVNKLLQSNVDKYLTENKVELLGQPLPKADENFDWDAEQLNFSFDLGLAPSFEIDLDKLSVPYHKIKVADEDVDKYVDNFRMRYGKMSPAEEVQEGAVLKGVFYELDENDEETAEHYHANLLFSDLKSKELFEGKKNEDKVSIAAQDIFESQDKLASTFGLEGDEVESFDKKLVFKINGVTNHEKAEINQELFDKVYGEGTVDSEEAFRNKIKEEAEKMYVGEADRVMLTNSLLHIVDNTPMDLPKEFLIKWIQFSNKEADTPEKAEELYDKSEKGMRFQLVEGKIANKYELSVTREDVETQAVEAVKQQMTMYGAGADFDDEMLKQIAQSALQNEEEYRRLTDQVFSNKMLKVVKDHVKLEEKEVSFDEFLEDVKAQNEKTI